MLYKAIVVEGLDGSGKDTIINNLVSRYKDTDVIPLVLNVTNNSDKLEIDRFLDNNLHKGDANLYKFSLRNSKKQVIDDLFEISTYYKNNDQSYIDENIELLAEIFTSITDYKFKQINTLLEAINSTIGNRKVLLIINRYISSTYVYYPFDVYNTSKYTDVEQYVFDNLVEIMNYSYTFLKDNKIKFVYLDTEKENRKVMIKNRNFICETEMIKGRNIIDESKKVYDNASIENDLFNVRYRNYLGKISKKDKLILHNELSNNPQEIIDKLTDEIIDFIK